MLARRWWGLRWKWAKRLTDRPSRGDPAGYEDSGSLARRLTVVFRSRAEPQYVAVSEIHPHSCWLRLVVCCSCNLVICFQFNFIFGGFAKIKIRVRSPQLTISRFIFTAFCISSLLLSCLLRCEYLHFINNSGTKCNNWDFTVLDSCYLNSAP